MGKTWVPNNTARAQMIGGKLVEPGSGAFVETPDAPAAVPVPVVGQLNGAGALELVANGAKFRALSAAKADAVEGLVSGAGNFSGYLLGPYKQGALA